MELLTKEQFRAYIYLEFRRGKSAADIYRQLQETGVEGIPSLPTVYRWHKEFQDAARTSLSDSQRPGRPVSVSSEENIAKVRQIVAGTPNISTSTIADLVGISKETARHILEGCLKLRKVCAVWVPHLLSEDQKLQRVKCAKSMIGTIESLSVDEFLRVYATEDETWIYFTSLLPKAENKAWLPRDAPRPRIVREQLSGKKTMLLMVFTGDGKFNIHATEPGETVDSQRYVNFLHDTGEKWRKLKSSPTRMSELLWQHDNARPHCASATKDFFERRHVHLVSQAPYSPDLNQCDRWLIKRLKQGIRQTGNINSANDVIVHSLRILRGIPKEDFVLQRQLLLADCHTIIHKRGDYITQ